MASQDIAVDFNIGGALAGVSDAAVAPDGAYVLKVTKAEAKSSKGSATKPSRPMIAMTCSIQGGPYAGLPVWHNFVWTEENENAKRFFRANLKALGINITPTTTMGQIASALVGVVFNATIGHREFNGTISNQIDKFGALQTASPSGTPVPQIATPAIAPVPQVAAAAPVEQVAAPITPAAEIPQAAPAAAAPAPAGVPAPPF
jgi:hypothetical protein